MYKKIQILGLAPYYIAVLHDVIFENNIAESIHVYNNLSTETDPVTLTDPLKIVVHRKNKINLDYGMPLVLGVSGGVNKESVFEYFQSKYKIAKDHFLTVIDKSSTIAISARLGKGCFVEQNVCIAAQTILGFGTSIKRGVSIGHHCKIEEFVDVNPSAVIAGKVKIGRKTTIGAGAIILDGIEIGENTIIGAGSVVTKDIPSNVIAFGNPCRIIKEI